MAWVIVAVALATGLFLFTRFAPRLATDLRRDLLTDQARVQLLEGFDGETRLRVWSDTSRSVLRDPVNPERDEIALLVRRRARLSWQVEARPGARLELGVARLATGPAEDAAPCVLTVLVSGPGELRLEVEVPPAPHDASVPEGVLREGPAVPVLVHLPEGAETLELLTTADAGDADDSRLAVLLSPRVLQAPLGVPREELGARLERGPRLLTAFRDAALPEDTDSGAAAANADPDAAAAAAPRAVFATRVDALGPGSLQPLPGAATEMIELPLVEASGGFPGATSRPALALLDGARAVARLPVPAGARLRGSVALDRRLPPGARATLRVELNDAQIAELPVTGSAWHELDLELPAGSVAKDSRLLLSLHGGELQPAPVSWTDLDFVRGAEVPAVYEAQRVRAGLAELRVVTEAQVPRRTLGAPRPSVILIQIETLRADALPFLAAARPDVPADLTPALSEFAREAVVWERAFAPSPWTVPTVVSLLTGLPPTAHGAVTHGRMSVPTDLATLGERARAAGVATGAVVTSDLLSEAQGYARGFEHYAHVPYANARQVNDLATAFLANHLGQQTFLFLHTFDPHGPVAAPEPWRDRYVEPALRELTVAGAEGRLLAAIEAAHRSGGPPPAPEDRDLRFLWQRYLGEVAYLDHHFGRLLEALDDLKLADDTVIIVTSDHGEEFLEHGLYGHGSQLFDETLHVPLLARAPRDRRRMLPGGVRVNTPVTTDGLHASVLDWLGVPDDGWRELVRPSLGRQTERAEPAWSETDKGLALDGLGDPLRRRLVSAANEELRVTVSFPTPEEVAAASAAGAAAPEPQVSFWDLHEDPGARRALPELGPRGEGAVRFLLEFESWAQQHRSAGPPVGGGSAELQALIELGYVGGLEERR